MRSSLGPELLGFFMAFLALPAVIAGFWLRYRMASAEKARFEGIWERHARSRSREFSPSSGVWPNIDSARVTWQEEHGAFVIESVLREGEVCTRVSVRPRELLLGQILVSTEDGNRTLAVAEPLAGEGEQTDRTFTSAYFVRERPAGFARRMLTEDVRKRLLAFRMGGYAALRYRKGHVSLVWRGGEENPARLDEATELLRRASAAVSSAFHEGGKHASAPRLDVRSASKVKVTVVRPGSPRFEDDEEVSREGEGDG
jgi:hypothetical protein